MSWHKIIYDKKSKGNDISIQLPASKSISNRLLILQRISDFAFEIDNLSSANDTKILAEILQNQSLPEVINCEDAGTVLRFMICFCATQQNKTFVLKGTKRLMGRPMKPLIDCLIELGAEIELAPESNEDPSIIVHGKKLREYDVNIAGNVSSQFISGLCLISPLVEKGITLQIKEAVLSRPYINLTLDLLSYFGIESSFENNRIRIAQQRIIPKNIRVEADWSSATFVYSFFLLSNESETLFIEELQKSDLQGDKYLIRLFEDFGVQSTFEPTGVRLSKSGLNIVNKELNLSNYPDIAIPLIVLCAFRQPKVSFSGLSHLREKESDRIYALQVNLEKFGILLEEENGRIWFDQKGAIDSPKSIKIETFSDHRIAMSFCILSVLGYKIELDNIDCINKSFPDFFQQFSKVGLCLKK